MASTYTSSLRLNKQGTGDNDGTWGIIVNTQMDLLDNAVSGYKAVAIIDGTNNLSVANGTTDDSRYKALHFTGTLTAPATVVIPDASAVKIIGNYTTGGFPVTFKTSSGTGISVPASTAMIVYSDAATVRPATLPINPAGAYTDLTLSGALTAASASVTNISGSSLTMLGAGAFNTLTVTATVSATFGRFDKLGVPTTASFGATIFAGRLSSPFGSLGDLQVNTVSVSALQATIINTPTASIGSLTVGSITGVALTGNLIGYQIFTASGTYTKATNNPSFVIVEVVGGGGGSGGIAASTAKPAAAGGGGGGGYSMEKIAASSLAASETVTIGAGGTAGSTSGGNGGTGGTTSFGTFLQATGGDGGTGWVDGEFANQSALAGVGSGGDINRRGGEGGYAVNCYVAQSSGSGSTQALSLAGYGGGSQVSPNNRPVLQADSNGQAGYANTGQGASGACRTAITATGFAGSAGGSGIVIVWEYS